MPTHNRRRRNLQVPCLRARGDAQAASCVRGHHLPNCGTRIAVAKTPRRITQRAAVGATKLGRLLAAIRAWFLR